MPVGATMPFKEFKAQLATLKAQKDRLTGYGCVERYDLLQGPTWLLSAVVTMAAREGDGTSPAIEVLFKCHGRQQRIIQNWDELTADQLMAVAKLRREIERWEAGERSTMPDPENWP